MLTAAPSYSAGMGLPVTIKVNFRGNVKRLLAPDLDKSEWESVDAWVSGSAERRALRTAPLSAAHRGAEHCAVQRGGPRPAHSSERRPVHSLEWRLEHSSERRPPPRPGIVQRGGPQIVQ